MIIHNGKEISMDKDILLDKWKLEEVTGDKLPDKPGYCIFKNMRYAINMLDKHIKNNSRIVFHTDVDVDGVGTTYIFKRALEYLASNKHLLLINKEKVHGIQQKHVDYFNNINKCVDLMIITDSSCNAIDIIKQFNCDVLVVDHHKLLHADLVGKCNDGIHDFVIVNNTIDNDDQEEDIKYLGNNFCGIEEYKGTNAMSCGLAVYELLRVYCKKFNDERLLENLMLYQWAGITLYTDVIDTLNKRNQYYIYKTVCSNDVERNLRIMMAQINKFKATLDKSYIQYSFAPLINKAIRAGKSSEVVDKVINNPHEISELIQYGIQQNEIIDSALTIKVLNSVTGLYTSSKRAFNGDTIVFDITSLNVHPNYTGVIASRLLGDYKKNTVVYRVMENGICKGSFRGRYKEVDYRAFFDDYDISTYAQGHEGAFGFEVTKDQLEYLMAHIREIEPSVDPKVYLTLGNMAEDEKGIYHIDNINDFRQQGYLWRIAIGNSKVISGDEIYIRVKASSIRLKQQRGKLYIYDVYGMECKAFEPMVGDYFDIYLEYTNELNAYLRKV